MRRRRVDAWLIVLFITALFITGVDMVGGLKWQAGSFMLMMLVFQTVHTCVFGAPLNQKVRVKRSINHTESQQTHSGIQEHPVSFCCLGLIFSLFSTDS